MKSGNYPTNIPRLVIIYLIISLYLMIPLRYLEKQNHFAHTERSKCTQSQCPIYWQDKVGTQLCAPASSYIAEDKVGTQLCAPAPSYLAEDKVGTQLCAPAPSYLAEDKFGTQLCAPAPSYLAKD